MMEGAYFVGRAALLQWINELTGLGVTRIEQTASGIVACHVFDALFPGTLRLDKVNFSAKREYEYVQNYKILQTAFTRLGISKHIFVEKLIRGKYQDNLEFMQWVKGYFDAHATDDALNYDAVAVRAALGKSVRPAGGAGTGPGGRPARSTASSRARATAVAAGTRSAAPPARARRLGGAAAPSGAGARRLGAPAARARPAADMVPKAEADKLREEISEMDQLLRDGDAEREFYFNKLQNIEGIVQDLEDQYKGVELDELLLDVVRLIKQVLYEGDAEGGLGGGEPLGEEPVGEHFHPADEVLQPEEGEQLDAEQGAGEQV